jgi:ABC-type lipoprotein export system ATPase subunit
MPHDTIYFYNTWEQMFNEEPVIALVDPWIETITPYDVVITTDDSRISDRFVAATLGDSIWLINTHYLRQNFGGDAKKLSDFRNQHLGFVFQFHQLLPEFTALENIMIPAYIAGISQKEARKRAKELLEFMGLSDRASHKPNELSGGEKQRVAVARALINNPAVILADEPSGSLDSKNKAELHQLFFDLRDKYGQTFVIVTHDEGLAELTDRTIHLKDGVVVGELSKGKEESGNEVETIVTDGDDLSLV